MYLAAWIISLLQSYMTDQSGSLGISGNIKYCSQYRWVQQTLFLFSYNVFVLMQTINNVV